MKKKILSMLLCFALCGTMLIPAACGGGNSGGGGNATLDFLYGGSQEIASLLTSLYKEYNNTQGKEDKVTVKGMVVAGDGVNDKIESNLGSRNGPDVAIGDERYFKVNTKNMMDVSGAFSDELLGSLYEKQEIRYHYNSENITSNEDDTLYGLPVVNDPTVLYYNRDALKAAGVICISVDAKDIAAFNAGTLTDYNGKTKSDYGLTINIPAKGYFRSSNNYVFNGDYAGKSWKKPTTDTILVFNDRIACSWDEIEDLGMLLTKAKNTKSTTTYGYYTEWWFNYGWTVGGDCLQDMNGKGDYTYSLPSTVSNYIVTEEHTYTGLYTGKTYAAGETIELADVINAQPTDVISYNSENDTTFYYTVNGARAVVRDDITEKKTAGVLNELPCTQEAFKRFCMLAATGGLNICPYPSAFNGATSTQFFSNGDLAMLVEYYSSYRLIKDTSRFDWGIAPLPVYKEYTTTEPSNDEVKRMGQEAVHSLGYYVAIRKGTPIKDQAIKFVEWLMTKGQNYAAQHGFVSAQKSDYNTAIDNLVNKVGKAGATTIVESSALSRAGDWWYMPDREWIKKWADPLNYKVRYGTLSFETYIYGYTEVSNSALKAYKGK